MKVVYSKAPHFVVDFTPASVQLPRRYHRTTNLVKSNVPRNLTANHLPERAIGIDDTNPAIKLL
jgi:hypothetical protein